MSALTPAQADFELARDDFLNSLEHPEKYNLSAFTTIKDVHGEIERIQVEQGRKGCLRNLKKIQPYLECITQFSGVIDTFVQVKPDILALIWGPIKLLLQIASTHIQTYDKILEVMAQMGHALPLFQAYGTLFQGNPRIHQVLGILYKDILEFHATILNFFSNKGWRTFLEVIWPKYGKKITLTLENIVRHRLLMDSEVTLASVEAACDSRARAYAEYKRQEAADEHKNFELVKLSLSPRLYDTDLEGILEKCCKGTGGWILHEKSLQKWLDPDDQSTRSLWLVGMPGAGKTFLSSTIIRHLQTAKRNVIFAYLLYTDSNAGNRLGIIHSFIFQLILDNKDLRPILIEEYNTNYRQMSSSVEFAQKLLQSILSSIGLTFVVVDGLDEVNQTERQALLKFLLQIAEDCPDLRLLIAGRDEFDIARVVKKKVQLVYIAKQNSQDIKLYVKDIGGEFIRSQPFDMSIISELEEKLDEVSVMADGMFLYARLVMYNITEQYSIEDLRSELSNLPNGLVEAYGRIMDRINKKLSEKEREKVRKIFEWLGCSSLPLRKEEIAHAVTILPGDKAVFPERRGFKDITHLCGPVIEHRGEYVAFVHFSFKEFIFGSQSDYFLRRSEAHRNIASTCISYLTFDCFGTHMDDSELNGSVLAGDFVLQSYAESQWFEHLKIAVHDSEVSPELDKFCETLTMFLKKLKNPIFESFPSTLKSKQELRVFKGKWPEICEVLEQVALFRDWQRTDQNAAHGENLARHDPLLISKSSFRTRTQLEALLCSSSKHNENCCCASIISQYGVDIYKCDRPACKFFHTGFRSPKDRDNHIRSHDRPFKCSVMDCDFAALGFVSEASLNAHNHRYHSSRSDDVAASYVVEGDTAESIHEILSDAVAAGEIDYVRSLLAQIAKPKLKDLLEVAVQGKSAVVVELLLERGYDVNARSNPSLLSKAFQGRNSEIVGVLLDHGADLDMRTMGGGEGNMHINYLLSSFQESSEIEAETIRCIQLILQGTKQQDTAQQLLLGLPMQSCSVTVAEYLLSVGAIVNGRTSKGTTALSKCCTKKTLKAAEFARYLLSAGADPSLKSPRVKVLSESPLAMAMPKLLGMTWEELVESTKHSVDYPSMAGPS